ncbi:MAG: hypothetical protein IJD04_01385 [Desulfovibrionaceae bacterium]|nr:hypothetical protein [Desulfovibrionaceae bacterium]
MSLNHEHISNSSSGLSPIPGMVAQLSCFEGAFPLLEIGPDGFSIKTSQDENMRPGLEALVEIMTVSQKKMLRCQARLIAADKNRETLNFEFVNQNAIQTDLLHKLLLKLKKM